MEDPSRNTIPSFIEHLAAYLPLHKRLYATVMVVTLLSQFFWPSEWWFFWPLLIWTVLFTLHVMVVKSFIIDDDWIEERSDEIAENALDIAHMETIRDQISKETYGQAYGSEKDKKPSDKD